MGFLPQREYFRLMQVNPLVDLRYHLCRCLTVHNPVKDADGTFIAAIREMYMWRIVVPLIQTYYDSKESAYFRHITLFLIMLQR